MGVIRGVHALPPRSLPYEVVDGDVVESADVCVIGSGAGGAVVAREMARAGKSVVLLERGGYFEGRDMNQRDMDMVPLLWKNGGFNFDDDLRIAIAQGACLGGSTVINDAVCFDPPDRVRAEWASMGMTFSEDEWATHLSRVKSTIHVSRVTEEELNRNNRMLREGARKLGLRDHWSNERNCINCMQCGFCHNGCHYDTKQSMLVTYLREAVRGPGADVRVYCDCAADTITRTDRRVDGVNGRFFDANGAEQFRIRVNARVVVVAAGAIASSHLLLKNRIASNTAGRGVCLHPSVLVVGQFPYEVKPNQGIPMAYSIHDFGVNRRQETTRTEYDAADGEFMIESITLPMMEFSMGMPGGPRAHHKFLQKFNQLAIAGMMARDHTRGRVRVGPDSTMSFTYDLDGQDRKSLARASEVTAKMWFALGAERVATRHPAVPFLDSAADIPKLTYAMLHDAPRLKIASAHPQSGNAVGSDPSASVVDADCRVHGFENLFVCDASVFPNAVGVNPQLTVMVVASMAADRMARAWDTRYGPHPLSTATGLTGTVERPMRFRRAALSRAFDGATHDASGYARLVPVESEPSSRSWAIDPTMLEVTNETDWQGFLARDERSAAKLPLYAKGFRRRFLSAPPTGRVTTRPLESDNAVEATVTETRADPFGRALLVEYPSAPHSAYTEVLKVLNPQVILGRLFHGPPSAGERVLDFSLVRRYPIEFMGRADHELLYARSGLPDPPALLGRWEGYLVGEAGWSLPLIRYEYSAEGGSLRNRAQFGNVVKAEGTSVAAGGQRETTFHAGDVKDELRAVGPSWLVGRIRAPVAWLSGWLPKGTGWYVEEKKTPRATVPIALRMTAEEGAYR